MAFEKGYTPDGWRRRTRSLSRQK